MGLGGAPTPVSGKALNLLCERPLKVVKKQTKGRKRSPGTAKGKVKFEVFGEEMLEKKVSLSGNSGRIYLPPDWVGRHVKIIRIN
jgi:putative transposon-encoded protein